MNDAWLSFARPAWLVALLPLAFFAWRYWCQTWTATPWRQVVDAHLLAHLLDPGKARPRLALIALIAALLCTVLALAGPRLQTAGKQQATHRSALHVLVIDLSLDAAPQLERTKVKLQQLLPRLAGAEVALLVYAQEPYLVVPPTTDVGVIARFIPELAIDVIPAAGNHPDRALRMAANLLGRNDVAVRSIVWMSSTGLRAPALPALLGIRLFVLHGGVEDDAALRTVAQQSGGMLQQMRNDDRDLQQLAGALAQGNRSGSTSESYDAADVGFWLLLPLLPLAALALRRGVLAWLPVLLCAGMFAPPAEAARLADLQAKRLFDRGQYDQAAERFANARWQAMAHYRAGRFAQAAHLLEEHQYPDSLYNRGNALAKLGFLPDALAAYEASLRMRPNDADAVHNRDLVLRLLNSKRNGGNSGAGGTAGQSERDAAQVAEQWLRSVPDEPATLLRRKLQIEHQRRLAGQAERPW